MRLRQTTRRVGFSLVELLVALGVTAILLAATAFAFQGGLDANEKNIRLHDAVVGARNTMEHVLRVCRTAESISVQPGTPYVGDNPSDLVGPTLLVELAAPDGAEQGEYVAFRWDEDSDDHPLKLHRDLESPSPTVTTMLPSVEQLTFEREVAQAVGGEYYTSRVIVTVTVRVGDMYHTLSGSVAPRKSLKLSG